MKILIVRLSSIGDCVMTSPVVAALRDRYPSARLSWVVQPKSVDVVRGLPLLDETILWDDRLGPRALLSALSYVRRQKFDVALDLHGLDKAALFMRLSNAPQRLSGTTARHLSRHFATSLALETRTEHARDFFFGRLAPLHIAADANQRFFPVLPVTPEHHAFADEFLRLAHYEAGTRLIGLNLGASQEPNRWAPERFALLALQLLQEDANTRVLIFGAPADAPLFDEFASAFERLPGAQDSRVRRRLISSVGRTRLLQMAALSARVHAFVTADTGPMHLAAAMGAPVLALFGPARVGRTGPIQNPAGAKIRVLDAQNITGSWPAPMDAHTVEAVLQAAREMAVHNLHSPRAFISVSPPANSHGGPHVSPNGVLNNSNNADNGAAPPQNGTSANAANHSINHSTVAGTR